MYASLPLKDDATMAVHVARAEVAYAKQKSRTNASVMAADARGVDIELDPNDLIVQKETNPRRATSEFT